MRPDYTRFYYTGWRPFIGWIMALSVLWAFIIHPAIILYAWYNNEWLNVDMQYAPSFSTTDLASIVVALLGMVAFRTVEKYNNIGSPR